jgi:hypothetical protein
MLRSSLQSANKYACLKNKESFSSYVDYILSYITDNTFTRPNQGRIHDFKLGGAHLKKLRRAEGGAKNFGVFRGKNHDYTPKKIIFCPILGGARRVRPPPGSAPANYMYI